MQVLSFPVKNKGKVKSVCSAALSYPSQKFALIHAPKIAASKPSLKDYKEDPAPASWACDLCSCPGLKGTSHTWLNILQSSVEAVNNSNKRLSTLLLLGLACCTADAKKGRNKGSQSGL